MHNMSAGQDISNACESSTYPPASAYQDLGGFSVNELKNCFNEFVNIKDLKTRGLTPCPEENDTSDVVKEVEHNELHETKPNSFASEECFSKGVTSPSPVLPSDEDLLDGEENQGNDINTEVSSLNCSAKSANKSNSPSMSPHTPVKLVSAMKGSREKQGIPPKKLSVTWAPDVYDPVPSAVSHVVSNKNYHHRSDSRKNGKIKQKSGSKSSRGSKGKDKRQTKKSVGSGSRSHKSLDYRNLVVGFDEAPTGILDYDLGSPVAYCGSSFLKSSSVTKLHFPATEAT